MANGSPSNTVKSFKSRLDRTFSRTIPSNGTSTEQLFTLLCHALVERASHHGDCVKELRRLVTCVSSLRQSWSTVHVQPALWLTTVEDLSDHCEVVNDADGTHTHCNFTRELPKTTSRQMKYIYEGILDRPIPDKSILRHVANELGDILTASEWGKRFAHDVCQYFAIYREGRGKLHALAKIAPMDWKAAARLTILFYDRLLR